MKYYSIFRNKIKIRFKFYETSSLTMRSLLVSCMYVRNLPLFLLGTWSRGLTSIPF